MKSFAGAFKRGALPKDSLASLARALARARAPLAASAPARSQWRPQRGWFYKTSLSLVVLMCAAAARRSLGALLPGSRQRPFGERRRRPRSRSRAPVCVLRVSGGRRAEPEAGAAGRLPRRGGAVWRAPGGLYKVARGVGRPAGRPPPPLSDECSSISRRTPRARACCSFSCAILPASVIRHCGPPSCCIRCSGVRVIFLPESNTNSATSVCLCCQQLLSDGGDRPERDQTSSW